MSFQCCLKFGINITDRVMRILIILLFISFSSLGQTFDDIMSIKDLNSFKRIVIENNLQFDANQSTDDKLVYEDVEGDDGAMFFKVNDTFVFHFRLTYAIGIEKNYTPYAKIYEDVKARCTFVQITSLALDYACYECVGSKFEGTLGFATAEGSGIVKQVIIK